MKNPNEDPNTDGKGADDTSADAGQSGSDTSAEDKTKEGTDDTTPAATADDKTKVTPVVDADDADEDDDDDVVIPGDDGEKKFTQTDLNKFIQDRLKTEKERAGKKLGKRDAQITSLTAELESYRNEAKSAVKTEFDALPQEVRDLAPASLDAANGVSEIKKWLPKAKTLAEKLSGNADATAADTKAKAKVVGNVADPKPTAATTADVSDAAVIEQAKKHSIYSSF